MVINLLILVQSEREEARTISRREKRKEGRWKSKNGSEDNIREEEGRRRE